MIRLSRFFYRNFTIIWASGLTVIMVLYASVVMGSQSECITLYLEPGESLLGLKFGYTELDVSAMFVKLESNALKCYLTLLTVWDNLFPVIYGLMYIAWISVIYKNIIPGKIIPLNLYPIVPVAIDWVENYFEAELVRNFLSAGSVESSLVNMASGITQIKWIASTGNYLLIVGGLLILGVQRFIKKRNQK